MEINILQRKVKISTFSIIVLAFFAIFSVVSLQVVREKILENSRVVGQETAAHFTEKENAKIKIEEMMLRSVAQNIQHMMEDKADWTDRELEDALERYSSYMKDSTEVTRFDMNAVIKNRLIGPDKYRVKSLSELKWYNLALANNGEVSYTNLYKQGDANQYVLTMAIRLNDAGDVLAINIYPEKLSTLMVDNNLPKESYYYLCDPNGKIMFAISDRDMSIEAQQPYVDHILSELRISGNDKNVPYIKDLEGNKRGVYFSVSDRGWMSIVTIPYDYLLGDYQDLLQWFILTLAFFGLLALVFGFRERELNKRVEDVNDIIQVMAKSFLAVFRVNLATGRYVLYKADALEDEEVLLDHGDYNDLMKHLVEHVEPDAAEEFAETFNLENVRSLVMVEGINDFGGEFRQLIDDQYKWVQVRLICDKEYLGKDEAIFFFRNVDAEKLKELEHLQLTEQALRVARENTKSRNMFFSAMSHDMRAPLNGIIGMAELAKIHADKPDQVQDYIKKIKLSGQQLLTLINDILEMARLDNAKVEHISEIFSVGSIAGEISGIYSAQAELEEKFYHEELPNDGQMVSGDLQGLRQVLNNILSNAFKYTPKHGSIDFMVRSDLRLHKNQVHYTFIVKDTGCGMSEEFLQKIFDPFTRDSRFGVPKVVGTGLGMMIVKSMVERMEGQIHITSEVDKGTCVIISLPFNIVKQAQTVDDENKKSEEKEPELKDFAGRTILVAEDNEINMEILDELLTMNGLEVIQALTGKEAVDRFEGSEVGKIDMILMDMHMPEYDGCEATQAIRQLERPDAQTVPIVALTGASSDEDYRAAKQAGMNDYMVKPVKMQLLAKMLQQWVKK